MKGEAGGDSVSRASVAFIKLRCQDIFDSGTESYPAVRLDMVFTLIYPAAQNGLLWTLSMISPRSEQPGGQNASSSRRSMGPTPALSIAHRIRSRNRSTCLYPGSVFWRAT